MNLREVIRDMDFKQCVLDMDKQQQQLLKTSLTNQSLDYKVRIASNNKLKFSFRKNRIPSHSKIPSIILYEFHSVKCSNKFRDVRANQIKLVLNPIISNKSQSHSTNVFSTSFQNLICRWRYHDNVKIHQNPIWI